uniref:deSI-like protein At4g17486 isoform X1 n=1 Tax=Erigeron canadensis TaxID=72917 RepID=UPI001CB982E3|nr:deSI-like protein At4g17486 isoform X1 [Erigeron canadensis]
MLCGAMSAKRAKDGSVPVFLNVYDLTSINGYAYWLGLGVYHSGVQVHGMEYAFGSHERETTGIFEGEPKQCEGFAFRKQILVGWTEKNKKEVRKVMQDLAGNYKGISYNLITKNCNHFCNDACIRLTGNTIPRWVNRLARLGSLCNCIIPGSLSSTRVGIEDNKMYNEGEMKTKLRSRSSRFASFSSSSLLYEKSSFSSPPVARTRSHRNRDSSSSSSSSS